MADDYPRGVEVCVSVFARRSDGRVLFATNAKWSGLLVPGAGGHVEPGETVLDAVRREAREEIGVELTDIRILGWGEDVDPNGFHRRAHWVGPWVVGDTEDDPTPDGEEVTDTAWLTPAEALARKDLAPYCRPWVETLLPADPRG